MYCHPLTSLETRDPLQPLPRLRRAWLNQCFHFVLAPQLPAAPQTRRPSRPALPRCRCAAIQPTRSQVSASGLGCGVGLWSFKLQQHPG